MTGFTLKIFILGLVAMVPSQDGDSLAFLVADATNATCVAEEHHIPAHRPVLLYKGESYGYEELDRYDILLSVEGRPSNKLDLNGAGNYKSRPNGFPGFLKPGRKSGKWLLNMEELISEAAPPASCFERPPGSCPVIARLRVDGGELTSCRYVADKRGVPLLRFRALNSSTEHPRYDTRALVEISKLEIDLPGETLWIKLRPFDASRQAKQIEIRPANGEIRLVLSNLPKEAEFAYDEAKVFYDPSGKYEEDLDVHFHKFFDILGTDQDRRWYPEILPDRFADDKQVEGCADDVLKKSVSVLPGIPNITACVEAMLAPTTSVNELEGISVNKLD